MNVLQTLLVKKTSDIKIDSVCGQYLSEHPDLKIQQLIEQFGITPLKSKSLYNNQDKYESGTFIPYNNDFLMAFPKLDKNGRALLIEIVKCCG